MSQQEYIKQHFIKLVKTNQAENDIQKSHPWIELFNRKVYINTGTISKTWGQPGVHYTYKRHYLLKIRKDLECPPIMESKNRTGRVAKDINYQLINEIAQSYNIKGNVISLGGNHQPEIIAELYKVIDGSIFFIENDINVFQALQHYIQINVRDAYKKHNIYYILGDITDVMNDPYCYLAIADIDLCGILCSRNNTKGGVLVKNLARGIYRSLAKKGIVSITTYNSTRGSDNNIEEAHKILYDDLGSKFKILESFSYNYWAGSFMNTIIYVLER